jgi:hypothetical protein
VSTHKPPPGGYIRYNWPKEPFNLRTLDGVGEVGPFQAKRVISLPDGTQVLGTPEEDRPTVLRIRKVDKEHGVIHANDGEVDENTRWIIIMLDKDGYDIEPES